MLPRLETTLALILFVLALSSPTSSTQIGENTDGLNCEIDVIVQTDDWLSKIADKFLGDELAYPAIIEFTNAKAKIDTTYATIENPDIIEPGWKLCIPSSDDAQAVLTDLSPSLDVPAPKLVEYYQLFFIWEWEGEDKVSNEDWYFDIKIYHSVNAPTPYDALVANPEKTQYFNGKWYSDLKTNFQGCSYWAVQVAKRDENGEFAGFISLESERLKIGSCSTSSSPIGPGGGDSSSSPDTLTPTLRSPIGPGGGDSSSASPPGDTADSTQNVSENIAVNSVEIAVLNIISEVQPDGTLKRTAELSVGDLGYGELELIAPERMEFEGSGIVWLTITPDSALEDLLPASLTLELANDPNYSISINDRIQVYPVMIAELEGVNFEINPSGPQKRAITSNSQVVWSWSLKAESPGRQSLVVTISIPVMIDETNEEISKELKNIPVQVIVEVTPTPTFTPQPTVTPAPTPTPTFTPQPTVTPAPTPTPTKTTSQRIANNLTDNASVLIGTILTFVLGVTTTWIAVATYRRQVKKAEEQKNLSAIREINDLTVEGIQSRVNSIDDAGILKDWLDEEKRNKNRNGAIEAILNRIKALSKNQAG